MSDVNDMIPSLMRLIKFRGSMSIDDIHKTTTYGKASIRGAVQSMLKAGLLRKNDKIYALTNNSKHWLGWQDKEWV
ncbi:MAG: hypothetical protein WC307_02855 [Candidatus Nanoarchaeia archaeon]|jgi:predicted transcriptional regulator